MKFCVGEQYDGFYVYDADPDGEAYGPFDYEDAALSKARELVATVERYAAYEIFVSRVY